MKLIIKDGLIDLGNPVYMDDEKQGRFIEEMEKIFDHVEKSIVEEIVPPGPGGGDQHKWDPEDLVKLFTGKEVSDLETELTRTYMSIGMKMVTFVPAVTKWMEENGIKQYPPTEEIINRYLHEKGLE
jgi:hypothetical protein